MAIVGYPRQIQAELLPSGALPDFRLTEPEIQFPEEVNVTEHFPDRNLAGKQAERIAFYSGNRQLTYRELHEAVSRLGNGLRAMKPEPIVQMHPDTAAKSGLREGDEVYIETKNGRIKQRLALDGSLDPRVVIPSFGCWFPEDAEGNYGWDRSNLNIVTYDEGPYDSVAGCMVLNGVSCRVYKA